MAGTKSLRALLQVRRPNNYVSNVASVLGPLGPDPGIDLSMLKIVRTVVPDSPSKLFIGGLPCDWNEEQVDSCCNMQCQVDGDHTQVNDLLFVFPKP